MFGLDLPQRLPIVSMACANETAGGVELVVVEAPAGLVQYGHPNIEGQPQRADSGNSRGNWGSLATKRFAKCGVWWQKSLPQAAGALPAIRLATSIATPDPTQLVWNRLPVRISMSIQRLSAGRDIAFNDV
jgi:hypothetical protein